MKEDFSFLITKRNLFASQWYQLSSDGSDINSTYNYTVYSVYYASFNGTSYPFENLISMNFSTSKSKMRRVISYR